MQNNNAYKKYIQKISHLLPLHTKRERMFLREMEDSVERFVEENDDGNIDSVVERFGTPLDVVHDYLSSMSEDELHKALSKSRIIKTAVIIVLIGIVIILLAIELRYEQLYRQAQQAIVTNEEITVEKGDGWK